MRFQKNTIFCINDSYPFLTIGKDYIILYEYEDTYLIESDNGFCHNYKKEHFITLSEKRENLIDALV